MELAFASVHQLCVPLLDRLERLPAPQRRALEIVFGATAGTAPDRFLVGLAVLSLLSGAAEERPLLCVVDDAQWLDRASAQTLVFVARRLFAERVGLVFAAREPGEGLPQLPQLEVRGLENDDACALLSSAVPFILDERIRDRIITETGGNPLALLELPQGLTATQLAGEFAVLRAQSLPGRIEESLVQRLTPLSDHTRRLLLLAAAEPVGDTLLLWRAAERLGIGPAAAYGAEAKGLLAISDRVVFPHPLVRSTVYRSASPEERRAAHLALAEVTDREADADRRAWHLATAAAGPDEHVALELERSAGRAEARCGLAAAALFLQRSAALSVDPARRAGRALAAADASLSAGAYGQALDLLAVAEAGPLDELQLVRLELLQANAARAQSRRSDASALLLRAAKTLEALDPKLAREAYLDAWAAALFAGPATGAGSPYDVSREVRRGPPAKEPARPVDLLLNGLALLLTEGCAAATPVLQQAATGFAGDGAAVDEVLRWGWVATVAAVVVWDYETCVGVATRSVQLARDAGALTVLVVALNSLAQAVTMAGELGAAAKLISEADAVTEATGVQVAAHGALYLGALRGCEPQISDLIDATVRDTGGQGTAVQYAHLARAVVLNARGRYWEAVAPSKEASDEMPELVVAGWALSELVEAAARSGEVELANSALERLAERNHVVATDWGLGIEARSRALLTEGPAAEGLYREAIERLGRTLLRPELARAHLLYGEWLRRSNRRVDARVQLRAAHDQFTSIGMTAFAERARGELLATGERVRKRAFGTRRELTAQEWQIACMARDRLSNSEIGSRLFLSQRTVEWHLGNVFTKVGVRSRRELANALPRSGSQSVPA
jgi:DNA-binding CsgD family transcriptional regulator